jgi:hypothetical protein
LVEFAPKKWSFFGRVYPDAPAVWLDLPHHHGESSLGFSYELQATIRQSKVSVVVTQTAPVDLPTLRNAVASDLHIALDLVGMMIGAGLEIQIDSATNDNGETYFFDGYVPVLKNEINIPLSTQLLDALGSDPGAQLMLADFKAAMRVPGQTGFHCYRAIEAAMQSFRQGGKNKPEAWKMLQAALKVDEAATRMLESYATGARHGEPVQITDQDRVKLLTTTKEIVMRYVEYVYLGRQALAPEKFPIIR